MKKKRNKTEISILDYFVVCQRFYNLINDMTIDEDRKYVLKKYSKLRGQTQIIESDHNIMWLDIDVPWNMKIIEERKEIFNLRNKDCQKRFYEFTSNSSLLSNSALIDDVKIAGKTWLKNMKFAILQNFRKVRISNKKKENSEISALMKKQLMSQPGSKECLETDQLIAEKIAERNKRIIIEQINDMTDHNSNLS